MGKSYWKKTRYANLYKREPAGTYYIRTSVKGRVLSKSLQTKDLQKARVRCQQKMVELLSKRDRLSVEKVAMTFADAVRLAMNRWPETHKGKRRTIETKNSRAKTLIRTFPKAESLPIHQIQSRDFEAWRESNRKSFSATYMNGMVQVAREAFNEAIQVGAAEECPIENIKYSPPTSRIPDLPTKSQFTEIIRLLNEQGSPSLRKMGEAIEFLAYGGFRWHEASLIQWRDIELDGGMIHVHRETKNSKGRYVPVLPQMRLLLERLKATRNPSPTDHVIQVKKIRRALDAGSRWTGAPRMTPHTMRHLFVTACLESGVDIPTVSRWVGHQDGGLLIGKVYGHLRDEHSATMASRVKI